MRIASTRLDARTWRGLLVTHGLLLALAVSALVVRDSPTPARDASPAPLATTTTSVAPPSTTTTTTPPPPAPPRLYFTKGPSHALHSIATGGGDERTEVGRAVRNEQVSPDGTKITYTKLTSVRRDIPCGEANCPYSYSEGSDVLIANRDGTDERVLVTGGYDDAPTWITNETLIYRTRLRETNSRDYDALAIVDTQGNKLGLQTTFEVSVGDFDVSPDGRSFAYESTPRGEADSAMVLQDIHTGAKRVLTGEGFAGVTWSPDGRQIAGWRISSPRGPFTQDVVSVAATGGPLRVLHAVGPPPANGPGLERCGTSGGYSPQVGPPTWSPDSSQLAFTSTAALTHVPSAALHDIVVMNRDGRNPRTVRRAEQGCSEELRHDHLTLYGWR